MLEYIFSLTIFLAFVTYLLTTNTLKWVRNNNLLDDPNSAKSRKYQKVPVPLLGGSPACLASAIGMSILWLTVKFNIFGLEVILRQNLEPFKLIFVILAILLMLVGGYLDDRYQMSPKYQILFILGAIALVVFGSGVLVDYTKFTNSLPYFVSVILTFTWLGFCTASTKFLDGHDGLVLSVGIISFATIASVAMLQQINQPLVALFSLCWIICLSVFAYWNFPNAKAYLGEGASEIIGFMIGVLSILSGAKVVTAFCILGWFILDILLVWAIRITQGKNPLTFADRNHWHHRLVDIGFNKFQVLVLTWLILLASSFVAIQTTNWQKFSFLGIEIIFLLVIFFVSSKIKKSQNKD
jgi:UDP-GlcNAc:undecaprenyl-phosphate/decaprenyl-phosphate GlcNAc-1-phosphate transferase